MSVMDELEKYGTPAEEIALLMDKLKDAEERGALSMLEHIIAPLKVYADAPKQEAWAKQYRETAMKAWREGREHE